MSQIQTLKDSNCSTKKQTNRFRFALHFYRSAKCCLQDRDLTPKRWSITSSCFQRALWTEKTFNTVNWKDGRPCLHFQHKHRHQNVIKVFLDNFAYLQFICHTDLVNSSLTIWILLLLWSNLWNKSKWLNMCLSNSHWQLYLLRICC